ncbi:hypothetical protein N7493_004495 [Penicillium malachiteum]|uniref:Alcohol dehydrogenase-like C-terminal domain-containing protein n=1 Tax=Penicillium malachiteum TaxID=1324776 RepID=A0AAD6HP81_9EURO|nr:hypothetical protein N7493_004495 [Penicillium malachiteum]
MEKSAAAVVVDTKTEIRQRDIPRPVGTEVLVKIEAAGHTVVDTRYIMRVPEDIAAEDAAPILCAGTTAYRALRLADLKPGQWVGIVGCGGGLGHLAVQYAKALELRVLGIDSTDKESICRTLGTDVFIDFTQTKASLMSMYKHHNVIRVTDGGTHGVLVVSSSPKAYEQALRYVRKMGALVCIGIRPEYFVAKGVRLLGSSTGTMNDTKEALDFVRDGRVKPITVKKKLGDIQECLTAIEAGEIVGRYIISAT